MSEVKFNGLNSNYSYYQTNSKKQSEEQKAEVNQDAPKKETVNADKMLDAMSLIGAQNFIGVQNKAEVNPAKFLTEDRISDIESSMAMFEQGVETYADAIKAEFGNAISEAEVYSLAAKAFALEA